MEASNEELGAIARAHRDNKTRKACLEQQVKTFASQIGKLNSVLQDSFPLRGFTLREDGSIAMRGQVLQPDLIAQLSKSLTTLREVEKDYDESAERMKAAGLAP